MPYFTPERFIIFKAHLLSLRQTACSEQVLFSVQLPYYYKYIRRREEIRDSLNGKQVLVKCL